MSNRSVKLFRIGICGLGALRRYHLKIFLIYNLCATLVEGIMTNNSVKLF